MSRDSTCCSARLSSGMARSHSRRAFTLLELLVVVGALLFLIAMLIPALSKAQRQARTATCLANVNQLFLASRAYVEQNSQSLPNGSNGKSTWVDILKPNLTDLPGQLLCPDADMPSYGFGSDKLAWGPYDVAHGSAVSMNFAGSNSSSYGFNGWLYAAPGKPFGATAEIHTQPEGFANLDKTPVFADAVWVDAWPLATDAIPVDTTGSAGRDNPGLARFYIDRHNRSVNVSFLDGHAEQVPLDSLSNFSWSIPGAQRPAGIASR